MTYAAISNQVVTDTTRRKIWPTHALGLLGGLALGVVARLWMRLIADDPAFTWNGTVFIVVGFMTFGMAQSIAAMARQCATRRWTLTTARVFGGVGILPLFVAAGGVMAPTVIAGGLAASRSDWPRSARTTCALIATIPVLFVGHGSSIHSVGRCTRSQGLCRCSPFMESS